MRVSRPYPDIGVLTFTKGWAKKSVSWISKLFKVGSDIGVEVMNAQ